MAGAPAPGPRQPRRGPAPFASFDHDVSDESSPESKQTFQLPEIREDPAAASPGAGLAPPEQRARSHSSPAVATGALRTPAAPRIDISRASSSSHHDSRDSSPEMALFAGAAEDGDGRGRLELGFREDGALELRSSTEELAFLEGAPGEPRAAPAPPPAPPPARRHSRKDSQGSEAALLAVSGRTSRLSSVGSQCSALSALSHASHVSRLSVVSGASRSPSPHKMLLETSFCGPKPIEAEPEICVAAVEERLLELARAAEPDAPAAPPAPAAPAAPANTRDHREVRTEVTVENARPPVIRASPAPAAPPAPIEPPVVVAITPAEEKRQKESNNRARAGRSRLRRDSSEPEVYKNRNRSKDIIRIKLKPDSEYEDDDEDESERTLTGGEPARKPDTLALSARAPAGPEPARRRSPSPVGAVSRKSSFCSLFKSRETIASPDSPCIALRRKKSLNEGRSRSKSRDRDRSATPTSAAKIRGSVLSLFKTPRRSAASPSPGSRASSPGLQAAPASALDQPRRSVEKLKYYEDTQNGVIHIPLHTPPDERAGPGGPRPGSEPDAREPEAAPACARPASAPQPPARRGAAPSAPGPPLPAGVIFIPLHSPTERRAPDWAPEAGASAEPAVDSDDTPDSRRSVASSESRRSVVTPESKCSVMTPELRRSVVTPESRCNVVTPESRRCVVTPESRGSVVTPESRGGVVTPESRGSVVTPESRGSVVTPESRRSVVTPERIADDARNGDARAESSSDEGRAGAREPPAGDERASRKRRLVFTTHVGSREQVFSTQFSITKTPSVTSDISGSVPNSHEPAEEARPPPLRDTHISGCEPGRGAPSAERPPSARAGSRAASPRDSSGSEPSSGRGTPAARGGSDVEQRGLVVQESFEDELPYVPTTLPLERSLALPMVPVRERAPRAATAGVRRPRAAPAPAGPPPAPPGPPPPPPGEKLRIKLPRRTRTASAGATTKSERPRTRSGGDGDSRVKSDWIDFEEVPERRKQPKRIQTLPAAAAGGAGGEAGEGGAAGAAGVVFSYVEPEQCRCECHAAARRDDELPLLAAPAADDLSSPEARAASPSPPPRPFAAFDPRARPAPAPALEPPPRPARRH